MIRESNRWLKGAVCKAMQSLALVWRFVTTSMLAVLLLLLLLPWLLLLLPLCPYTKKRVPAKFSKISRTGGDIYTGVSSKARDHHGSCDAASKHD